MTFFTALILFLSPAASAQEAEEKTSVSVDTIEDVKDPVPMTCRRLIGMAGGMFDPGRSWEFATGPVAGAASPVLGMGCDVGGSTAVSVSLETLPLYNTRQIGSSDGSRQWLNISVGALLNNNNRVRFGPLATVGWRRGGVGARVMHLPFGDSDKPTGFEYRLQGFFNGSWEIQGMVSYTLTTNRYPR